MEWTADVAAGDWLRDRLDDPWRATMHDVVPRGFDAYARIFHPATRDRPVGRPWPGLPYARHAKQWRAFQASAPQIDVERISWSDAAAAFSTHAHPLAQWEQLVGVDRHGSREDGPRDAGGWRYEDPAIGGLAADLVSVTAEHLAVETAAPDDVIVGVWEGWGGLAGGVGYGRSRVLATFTADDDDDPGTASRHDDFLAHATRDTFNDVFRRPEWQPGVLSDEVSRGPRLQLPHRGHLLFRGGVTELTGREWKRRMPWTDPDMLAAGFPDPAESPSLIWPADRRWVFACDVDWNFSIVGGSRELVRSLCREPLLEAMTVAHDADVSSTGDRVNR